MRRHLKVAAVVTILLFGARAEGTMLTFQFAGEVTAVVDPLNHLGGDILVGMPFTGSYSFLSSAVDKNSDPSVGAYDSAPPFTVELGTLSCN